jgi:hypothetical protein
MRPKPHIRTSAGHRPTLAADATSAELGWPVGIALVAVIAALMVYVDAPSPFRPLAVLIFLGFGPGLSLVGLFGISDLTQRLVLGMGTSIALDTLVAGVGLYVGLWSPSGIFFILVALTLLGAGLQLRAVARARAATSQAPETSGANEERAESRATPVPILNGWHDDPRVPWWRLTDPNPDTLRSIDLHDALHSAEVGLDIGFIAPIDHLRWHVTSPAHGSVEVQLSDDGLHWHRLVILDLATTPAGEHQDVPVVTWARFVKFVFTDLAGAGAVRPVRGVEIWTDESSCANQVGLLPSIHPALLPAPAAAGRGRACHLGTVDVSGLVHQEITS